MDEVKQEIISLLKGNIRNIPDFPKPGIQFKDITPLLRNPDTLELTSQILARPFRYMDIDYVVGLRITGAFCLVRTWHKTFMPALFPSVSPASYPPKPFRPPTR
ncbi:MAG: hypothetical protein U5J63_01225 [Fodinibius sp.]|nr:hypothetical protein [Fodinibius sp.]